MFYVLHFLLAKIDSVIGPKTDVVTDPESPEYAKKKEKKTVFILDCYIRYREWRTSGIHF